MFPEGPGARELKRTARNPEKLIILPLDVTSDESVTAALIEVSTSLKLREEELWGLVNNAGIHIWGEVEWATMNAYHQLFEVNVFGMVRVTRAFLPLLRASRGRVVNMASLASRVSGFGMNNYCMSKRAVVAFSECLRREMVNWGVKVATIEPEVYR